MSNKLNFLSNEPNTGYKPHGSWVSIGLSLTKRLFIQCNTWESTHVCKCAWCVCLKNTRSSLIFVLKLCVFQICFKLGINLKKIQISETRQFSEKPVEIFMMHVRGKRWEPQKHRGIVLTSLWGRKTEII